MSSVRRCDSSAAVLAPLRQPRGFFIRDIYIYIYTHIYTKSIHSRSCSNVSYCWKDDHLEDRVGEESTRRRIRDWRTRGYGGGIFHESGGRREDSSAAAGRVGGSGNVQEALQEYAPRYVHHSEARGNSRASGRNRAGSGISGRSQWHKTRWLQHGEELRAHTQFRRADGHLENRSGQRHSRRHRSRHGKSFLHGKDATASTVGRGYFRWFSTQAHWNVVGIQSAVERGRLRCPLQGLVRQRSPSFRRWFRAVDDLRLGLRLAQVYQCIHGATANANVLSLLDSRQLCRRDDAAARRYRHAIIQPGYRRPGKRTPLSQLHRRSRQSFPHRRPNGPLQRRRPDLDKNSAAHGALSSFLREDRSTFPEATVKRADISL